MKKKLAFALPILVLAIMMITGCGKKSEGPEIYSGTTPCANCEGILMTLKISPDYQSYELSRTYIGQNENPFIETGKMNTERGFEDDNDATVFILNYDKEVKSQTYMVRYSKDNSQVYLLSSDKKRIDSQLNYILKKQ